MNPPPALARLYAAGEVQRWHANPAMAREGQTNADHQGRCVQLLLILHPLASPALIQAVAFHDVGEVMGDLPAPAKRAHPGMAAAHAVIETAAREAMCGPDPWLTPPERDWLHLVDKLEALAFVLMRRPGLALRDDWKRYQRDLLSTAQVLGVAIEVQAMIDGLMEDAF